MATSGPQAQKTASTFRQDCRVSCEIRASAERVWALLTEAKRYPAWNSTVTSLDGTIALGEKLALKVPLDPKRTFTPRVTKLVGAGGSGQTKEMEWSDGFAPMFKGVRTFTLREAAPGVTEFAMVEVFTGAMLPMIRKSLPDFGPAFERFARDLKAAAEA